jgi:hypothetical protein
MSRPEVEIRGTVKQKGEKVRPCVSGVLILESYLVDMELNRAFSSPGLANAQVTNGNELS